MAYTIGQLSNNEAGRGFTHVAVFDYEGIADNATSANQVTIATIPAGGAVEMAAVFETTALAGASDITVDVGTTSADPDEFINAGDVDAGVALYNTGDQFDAGTNTTATGATQPVKPVTADTDVLVEWNGTTGSLTAGEVVIALRILDPANFKGLA